ncbi:uncharacterized protein LY89DRAFT_665831 [Mollisia scopiformis]|uniref:Uncharacterized protein n=1 Tax=Mollisia scopiformis TaxID=149040 RepID=A0A194XML0_MOLSC|nr:uncharacterized protein LY89DRAFT_665831 [Mollisia scopiformis]KUJ21398.1 hypothetical protein LY89DRAFT_665831 [Mollisia scopiformis]
MASYKSGFDPPTRPGETSRARRLGTYMQQHAGKQEKLEHREADIAHLSGQMDTRRPSASATTGRAQQTTLPRPRMREPSPSTRPKLEGARTGSSSSSFGYSRNAPKPAAKPTPELRGKSSRNVLRRKPSSVAQDVETSRPKAERQDSSSSAKVSSSSSDRRPSVDAIQKSSDAYNEIFTRPPRTRTPASKESPQIYPELDRYRSRPEQNFGSRNITDLPPKLSTQDLPPHNPMVSGTPVYSGSSSHHRYSGYSGSGYSASPSTRFSESPGPGAYSRDTTPTSISSQSPGILAPMKTTTTPRLRQGSPALNRPPVTARRRATSIPTEADASPQGLPSLRESITSSSSNSTVKGDGKGKEKEKKKKKRLSPLPPSPPPRKSSQKFKKPRSDELEDSPSKPSQAPARPVMMSPIESSPAKPVRAVTSPVSKAGPPARPSREGAPDLHAQWGDVIPIVQSNLTGLPQNRRQSSLPLPRSVGTSPQLSSQPTLRPQPGRRNNPSPSPILPSPREATPAPSGLGIIPDLRPHLPGSRSISRTPSPSTKPRFGLFSRRTKTTPEVNTLENRGSRKGPAAGTGHEGYGKYATRGRSSSAGGFSSRQGSISLSIATSSSQESVSSTRTHDPFLLHRMSPVIIAGGGEIIENRNEGSELLRTESGTSLLLGGDRDRPSLESKASGLSNEVSRTTLWPSAMPREPISKRASAIVPKGRRPSDSSDDVVVKRSLGFRRSVQRLDSSIRQPDLPRPLNFGDMVVSPSMTSLDASILSDEMEIGTARKGVLTKPKKLEKKPKETRKWNFFHRSQPTKPQPDPVPAMAVVVGKAPTKAVPHYALLDSSDEQVDPDSVNFEDLMHDAEVVAMSNEELDALQFGSYKEKLRRNEIDANTTAPIPEPTLVPEPRVETPPAPVLFSSPEPMQIAERPKTPQTDLHLTQEPARVRPSRLPQVGRIPKVISARPETTSPKSFSRPFARLSTLQPLVQPLNIDKESVAIGPSPPKPSTPELHIEPQLESSTLPTVRQESLDSKSSRASTNHRDFLAFSPRKNSEATTSSSGGGLSFADTTAVIPLPDDPLEEDEMWDEYDDLIEHDDTIKVPISATSSQGMPFQYESYESRRLRKSKIRPKESPTLTSTPVIKEPEPQPERRSALTSSSVYSVDMSARLKDALTAIPSPTTPLSFTEFFSGYGDRNNSIHGDSAQKKRRSSGSRKSNSSNGLIPIAEQDTSSPISQVNLRVGSMTVSKWLTFGHVLFSPAREDIDAAPVSESSKRHSILVIDGLGNDDWSFYAAETYSHSTFYNLSPTHPPSQSSPPPHSRFPSTPPNHRQIHWTTGKLPFPSSTFTIVVYRFPALSPLSSYRHIIAEAKRVLKPGGYLELAILDLDMLTMGPITRRAVRGLKLRLSEREEGTAVSLGSAADEVLKVVGKRGFEGVRSCVVAVPVASAVSGPVKGESEGGKGREMESLPDLLRREGEGADKDITTMVARVGRWWWGRCYESTLASQATGGSQRTQGNTASSGGRSIFDDTKVLNECEDWGTSFKLCVGVARKPSLVSRRRGASV